MAWSVSGKGTVNGNSKAENDFINKDRVEKHRPCLIWFDDCTNARCHVHLHGLLDGDLHALPHVHVNRIQVKESTFRYNDGCNILDCENAVVENSDINALDDGICLKGYTAEGCRNAIIRNNRVRSLCNGVKAGTDFSGGFQNILIENNMVWQTGIAGIALELVDGGVMRNVVVRNLKMDMVETPIFPKLGQSRSSADFPPGTEEDARRRIP